MSNPNPPAAAKEPLSFWQMLCAVGRPLRGRRIAEGFDPAEPRAERTAHQGTPCDAKN